MVYIKFTNGSVTKLIDVNNEIAQNDALENGFYMLIDKNGTPEVVESDDLVKNRNVERAAMLQKIADKLEHKNRENLTKSTLASKHGK